jgi:hypothetical protein
MCVCVRVCLYVRACQCAVGFCVTLRIWERIYRHLLHILGILLSEYCEINGGINRGSCVCMYVILKQAKIKQPDPTKLFKRYFYRFNRS